MTRLSNPSRTMSTAALDAMIHVLDLVPDDRVVVVTDPQTARCGEAFAAGAEQHGCPVIRYTLPATGRPLSTVPDDMAALIEEAGRYADRLSINIELPTSRGLARLAPED